MILLKLVSSIYIALLISVTLLISVRAVADECDLALIYGRAPFERVYIINHDSIRHLHAGSLEDVLDSHRLAVDRLKTWVYTHSLDKALILNDTVKIESELEWHAIDEVLSDPSTRYGKVHFFPAWIDPQEYERVARQMPPGLEISRGKPRSHVLSRIIP